MLCREFSRFTGDHDVRCLNYSASSAVMAIRSAFSLPYDSVGVAGAEGARDSVGHIAERQLAHLLDTNRLDCRSGDEDVHGVGQPSSRNAKAAGVVR
jgi:hypothetical protein